MYGEILEGIKKDLRDTRLIDKLFDAIESCITESVECATPDEGFDFEFGQVGVAQDAKIPDMGCGDAIRCLMIEMAMKELIAEDFSKRHIVHTESTITDIVADIESEYREDMK